MESNTKKYIKVLVVFLLISVVIEMLCFNYEWFYTFKDNSESVTVTHSEDFTVTDNNKYLYPEVDEDNESSNEDSLYFEISDINKRVKYVYFDVTPQYEDELNEACFDVYLKDEGFSDYYYAGNIKLHPMFEKTKYFRVHPYGELNSIKLVTDYDGDLGINTSITLNAAEINARVPVFFSPVRVIIISMLFVFIYMFRPSSKLYRYDAFDNSKRIRMIRMLFMAVNIIAFALLLSNNLTLANPSNATYRQYNLLAEAISQGRVNIDVGYNDIISQVSNPYDVYERRAVLAQNDLISNREPWHDIAYFNGNFYVYFGIVPELLFYLPIYLIAKVHMVTSAAFFLVSCLIIVASYEFVDTLVKGYFPKTSFGVRLFSSVMIANGISTLSFIMKPTIYYIVIITSLLFIILGITMWLKARILLKDNPASKKVELYIALGALFMALVVGCRPTMVLSSFLVIPIFCDVAFQNKKLIVKDNFKKYISLAIPYVAVAAGIMYYNHIRFGSPFDFGANYNLTTNDMNLRGSNLERLVDGFYMYIFEPPTIITKFPFLRRSAYGSNYIGYVFIEAMYGGVIFTSCFTLFWLMIKKVKKSLKDKGLYPVLLTMLVITIVTIIADTEMGGLHMRYMGDFLYLLIIGAVIIMLALFEKFGHKKQLVGAMLILGLITLTMNFFISVNATDFQAGSTEGLFNLYNFFI